MSAPLPKISVGACRNLRLSFCDGFDGDVCFFNEIIKPPRGYGTFVSTTFTPLCPPSASKSFAPVRLFWRSIQIFHRLIVLSLFNRRWMLVILGLAFDAA
jgi:hypothetical protein